ncbi:MAG: recombinase family protein, partial [Clostridia bacterium]|nr:recombinase family protein [Clostridia bacterium]
MLSVFSEFERKLIAERIRDNMHELAKSGRWLGGTAPTGFISKEIVGSHTVDGKVRKAFMLEPVEDEIATVKVIFDKYIELASQSKLITFLMNEGYITKNNVYYSRLAVKAILTNPVYVAADENMYEYFSSLGANVCAPKEDFNGKFGIMAYNKTLQTDGKANKKRDYSDWIIAIGKHKPIITSEDWLKAQKLIEYRGKTTKRYPRTEIALLSGLLYCGNCGSHMRPKLGSVRNDGSKQLAYRCVIKEDSRKQLCNIRNIDGYEVDNIVLQQIFDLSEKLKTNTVDISTLRKTIEKPDIDYDAEIKKCERKIVEKDKRIKNATIQLTSYDINDPIEAAMTENLKIEIKELITDKTALETKLKNLQSEKEKVYKHYSDLDGFADSLASFTEDYPNMSYDDRLKAIRSIVDFVIYHEDTDSVEVIFKGSDISKNEYLLNIKPTGMHSK